MRQTITTDENGCATVTSIGGATMTLTNLKPHTTYDFDMWVDGDIPIPKSDFEKFHDAAVHLWDLIVRELRLEQFVRWLNERLTK